MLIIYNIVLHLLIVILSPFILYKMMSDKRYRSGLSERFGSVPDDVIKRLDGGKVIWYHASSVGEVMASLRLLESIRKRWPDHKILVSAFTPTGKATALEKAGADGVIFLPLDLPLIVNRVMKRVRPSALILMETELWPNLICAAGRRDVPVMVVNGRISDGSYGKYWLITPVLKRVFRDVKAFLMQSEGDAGRITSLGAGSSKVLVSGNIKFDMSARDTRLPFMEGWGGEVLVAGSTHKGEDGIILDIFDLLSKTRPSLRLVLAPRHLERIGEVESLIKERRLSFKRRSDVAGKIDAQVLVINTVGELVDYYKYADVVFIGGSLVPVGGHNILEPALYGRPVLYGPQMRNFRDADRILTGEGGIKIQDVEELRIWIDKLLDDTELRRSMGEKALASVMKNRGAIEKTIAGMEGILPNNGT